MKPQSRSHARLAVALLAAALVLTAQAGDDDAWMPTGGLRPDDGRGLNNTAILIDPLLGVVFSGSQTGTIYLRPEVSTQPPLANDEATTPAQTPVTISVLDNDIDPEGGNLDPANVAIITAPAHGIAEILASGAVRYTPVVGFIGSDDFTYVVGNDCGVLSAPANVSVTTEARSPHCRYSIPAPWRRSTS
jgi:hypothetical protein